MSTTRTDTQVVIIGAGQAGLAVAYYLRRFELAPGADFIVYDRGPGTGGAWQHRWDALKLGSAHHVTDLPGMRELGLSFETADRTLPAKDIVGGYYRRYEEHFGLEVQRPVAVSRVFDRGADLVVEIVSDGSETKDNERLPALYARAGIPELWLVDARGAEPRFEIRTLAAGRYERIAPSLDGTVRSPLLGLDFRLTRERTRFGGWRYKLAHQP